MVARIRPEGELVVLFQRDGEPDDARILPAGERAAVTAVTRRCAYIVSGRYLPGMTRHPTTPPIRWDIYKLAPKQTWIGEVEASDERQPIEIAARLPLSNLMAVRR